MLKRLLFPTLAFSLFLAGCGGSDDSDNDRTNFLPGTYGVVATQPNAPTQRLYEGNVTVDAAGNLSGLLFGTAQSTTATVSGTIDSDGTIDLSAAFTQPIRVSGQLTRTEDEYRGRLDGTIQTGTNTVDQFEADVIFGAPLS